MDRIRRGYPSWVEKRRENLSAYTVDANHKPTQIVTRCSLVPLDQFGYLTLGSARRDCDACEGRRF